MIDINLIRENPEEMKKKLAKKLVDVDFTELLEKDKERKVLGWSDLAKRTDQTRIFFITVGWCSRFDRKIRAIGQ